MSVGSHRNVRPGRQQETDGDQAAAGAALCREVAAGAGAARTAGALASSAGRGAEWHPVPGPPRAGGSRCAAVRGKVTKWRDAKCPSLGMKLIHDSAIYLESMVYQSHPLFPRIVSNMFTDDKPEAQKA